MFTGCLLAYIKKILMSSMPVGTQILNGEMSALGWLYWQMNFHKRSTESLFCLPIRAPKKANVTLKPFRSQTLSKYETLQQHFLVRTVGLERQSAPQQL